jgi:hypothetical protein
MKNEDIDDCPETCPNRRAGAPCAWQHGWEDEPAKRPTAKEARRIGDHRAQWRHA